MRQITKLFILPLCQHHTHCVSNQDQPTVIIIFWNVFLTYLIYLFQCGSKCDPGIICVICLPSLEVPVWSRFWLRIQHEGPRIDWWEYLKRLWIALFLSSNWKVIFSCDRWLPRVRMACVVGLEVQRVPVFVERCTCKFHDRRVYGIGAAGLSAIVVDTWCTCFVAFDYCAIDPVVVLVSFPFQSDC